MNIFVVTIQHILEFKRYKIYIKILLLCLLFILCVILIKWCIITFI